MSGLESPHGVRIITSSPKSRLTKRASKTICLAPQQRDLVYAVVEVVTEALGDRLAQRHDSGHVSVFCSAIAESPSARAANSRRRVEFRFAPTKRGCIDALIA